MKGYNLNNFLTGKAFIYFNGVINGKSDYGPRICINTKGEKLFELPDKNMKMKMWPSLAIIITRKHL